MSQTKLPLLPPSEHHLGDDQGEEKGNTKPLIHVRESDSGSCSHSLTNRQPDGSLRCSYCGVLLE